LVASGVPDSFVYFIIIQQLYLVIRIS